MNNKFLKKIKKMLSTIAPEKYDQDIVKVNKDRCCLLAHARKNRLYTGDSFDNFCHGLSTKYSIDEQIEMFLYITGIKDEILEAADSLNIDFVGRETPQDAIKRIEIIEARYE